jgi:hypothetical protein
MAMTRAEGRIRLEGARQIRLQDLLPVTDHPPYVPVPDRQIVPYLDRCPVPVLSVLFHLLLA